MTTTAPSEARPGNGPEKPSGRHPVNVGHLVMGIAFLGLVGVWALIQGDVVGDGDVRWLLPVPWVLAGLAGLLAIALSSRRRWSATGVSQVGWVDTPDRTSDTADDPETPETPETPDTPDDPETEEHR